MKLAVEARLLQQEQLNSAMDSPSNIRYVLASRMGSIE